MNDFLFKLCSAIATEEGFFVPGTLPAKNNNPGDLRAAPWLTKPRRKRTPAERKAQGERMKLYWQKRRAAKAVPISRKKKAA